VAPAAAQRAGRSGDLPAAPWVAYQSNLRDGAVGQEGIFLVRVDGAEDHEVLTGLPGAHLVPSGAPSGRRLVFSADIGNRPRELYTADADGTDPRRLLRCTGDCETDDDPAFSPNGRQVAFERVLGPDVHVGGAPFPRRFELRVATVARDGVRRVRVITSTYAPVEIDQPRWSPDGSALVFWEGHYSSTGQVDRTAVFVVRADGTGLRRLTPWRLTAGEADWSPNGRRIVFDTHPLRLFNSAEVVSNLYTVRPDGTGLLQVTTATGAGVRFTEPKYTADGRIGFTRVTPIDRTIWTIRADGAGAQRLTLGGRAIQTHPEFQP
jgi:Tol biopolymer transport system component